MLYQLSYTPRTGKTGDIAADKYGRKGRKCFNQAAARRCCDRAISLRASSDTIGLPNR
jgi:hypothetical protein